MSYSDAEPIGSVLFFKGVKIANGCLFAGDVEERVVSSPSGILCESPAANAFLHILCHRTLLVEIFFNVQLNSAV